MRFGLLLLGLVGLLRSATARADEYQFTRVRLLSTGCAIDGLGEDELRAAVASELAAGSLVLVPALEPLAASEVAVSVRLPCAPEPELVLGATFSGISFRRAVSVDELPRASRARALALLLAELLVEFATPELAEDAPPPARAAPALPPAARAPVAEKPAPASSVELERPAGARRRAELRARREPPRLGAGPELRTFFSGPSVLGGRVHGDWDRFSLGISVLGQSNQVSAGLLSALIVEATGAARLLTLGDPARTSLCIGPRFGLGYVLVTAQPTEPNVEARAVRELYFDGAAVAELRFQLLPGVRVGFASELGFARGVVALVDSTEVGHYGGGFASALLDAAFEL